MIDVTVPGRTKMQASHVVLDVNGTLALDGALLPDVADRLRRLQENVQLHLITADTHDTQGAIDLALGVTATRLPSDRPGGEQKAELVRRLGAGGVVAIGNGVNDALMLREAALSIVVLGGEGLAMAALREADVLTASIEDALDLLLHPRRLVATLRT